MFGLESGHPSEPRCEVEFRGPSGRIGQLSISLTSWENSPMILGRDYEIRVLGETVERARGGLTQLVCIEGLAGLGKSTLVEETIRNAHDAGFASIVCRTDEFNGVRPFGPIIDALRADPKFRSAHLRIRALLDAPSDGLSPILMGVAPMARESVIEAMNQLLEEILLESPLLFVVEDIHWADDATLETIRRLNRTLLGYPLLMLVTARPFSSYTATIWDAIHNEANVELSIDELDPTKAQELVSSILNRQIGPNLRTLINGAGGNPLLLHDLIRAVEDLERPGGKQLDLDLSAIPTSLRERIKKTLRVLSPQVREIVQVVSILGSAASIDDVAAMRRESIQSTARLALDAERTGLVGVKDRTLSLRHELVRAAVEDSIPETERVLLNRSAALMLISRNAPGAMVALHLDRGRLAEPESEAVERMLAAWLVKSANEVKTQSPRLALDLIEKARLSDPALAVRPEVLLIQLESAAHCGMLQFAEEVGSALLAAELSAAQRVEATLWLGGCHLMQEKALEAAQRFEEAIPSATPSQEALLCAYKALALLTVFDSGAFAAITRAVEISRVVQCKPALTLALGLQSRILAMSLEYEQALTSSQSSIQVAQSDGTDDSQRYVPMFFHSLALYDLDRHREAQAAGEVGRRKAEELGAFWAQPFYHGLSAWLFFTNGDKDQAEVEARAGVIAANETGSRLTLLWSLTVLAHLSIERGKLSEAADWVSLGEKAIASGDGRMGAEVLMTAKSRLLEATGDLKSAVSNLSETWDLFDLLNFPICLLAICPEAIRLATKAHNSAFMQKIRNFLGDAESKISSPRADAYRRSLNACRDGLPEQLAVAVSDLRKLGRHAEAQTLAHINALEPSNSLAETTGFTEPSILTVSERKVAELVSAGGSNKNIALELGISRRTVETHVTRVLRKLNVESRLQLAIALKS
jgi:DNA-binding CsgD family transcriptional regulator